MAFFEGCVGFVVVFLRLCLALDQPLLDFMIFELWRYEITKSKSKPKTKNLENSDSPKKMDLESVIRVLVLQLQKNQFAKDGW